MDNMTLSELINGIQDLRVRTMSSKHLEGLPPKAAQFMLLALVTLDQAAAFVRLAREDA